MPPIQHSHQTPLKCVHSEGKCAAIGEQANSQSLYNCHWTDSWPQLLLPTLVPYCWHLSLCRYLQLASTDEYTHTTCSDHYWCLLWSLATRTEMPIKTSTALVATANLYTVCQGPHGCWYSGFQRPELNRHHARPSAMHAPTLGTMHHWIHGATIQHAPSHRWKASLTKVSP